ncbi:hypothetical protein, partial [Thiobacillus sp.]
PDRQFLELGRVLLLRYLLHLSSSQVNVNTTSPLEDEISGEAQPFSPAPPNSKSGLPVAIVQ